MCLSDDPDHSATRCPTSGSITETSGIGTTAPTAEPTPDYQRCRDNPLGCEGEGSCVRASEVPYEWSVCAPACETAADCPAATFVVQCIESRCLAPCEVTNDCPGDMECVASGALTSDFCLWADP